MNQSYIYWLFTEQLKEQERLASSEPQGFATRQRRPQRPRWRGPVARRRNRLDEAAPLRRTPVGCSV